jgi:hypothetical protein
MKNICINTKTKEYKDLLKALRKAGDHTSEREIKAKITI